MQSFRDTQIRINSFFTPSLTAAILLFALNLFFVFNYLVPSLQDLNGWDESVYINTGRALFEGTLPVFARNPLTGLLYAITYAPYQSSPLWLVQSAALGRFVLFILIWLSTFLVAREFSSYANPLISLVFVLVYPVTVDILTNPSDSLFAAMSGFAFWQVLRFYNKKQIGNIWGASFFIGLAAHSRNDGIVSFVILVALISWLAIRYRVSWQWIPALTIPFAMTVGGYLLIYGLKTGNYSPGTRERSYVAFQQGQQLVYENDPDCRFKRVRCAVFQAERIYGSGAENDYSVFHAIANNPQAYSERLLAHFRKLPKLLYYAYGIRTALLLFFLGLYGFVDLVRKKEYALLILLVAWTAYLGVYFLTFFREGYLRTPFFVFFIFGAVGVQALVENLAKPKEYRTGIIFLAIVTLAAFFAGIQALYFTTVLLLLAMWAMPLFKQVGWNNAGLLILFLVGLMLRPAFDPPVRKVFKEDPGVLGVLTLVQKLPEGSQVASGAPGAIWMARMEFIDVADLDYGPVTTPEALYEQFKKDGVDALYVDSSISNANPEIWGLIIPGIGRYYEPVFVSPGGGDVQVFLLK